MKLQEEHCSIGFSRPLTNQNKNPFSYGSMELYCRSKGDTLLFCYCLFSHSGVLQMKILDANAGPLTNFEVLDFLRSKGASKDPTSVIAKVAQSEYKVYDYLVDTAASVQTRESTNEFLTRCFYSTAVGGLRCYENPKNKITAVPAEEEDIWGAFFKNRESVISPNSNIRLMSVETALGTKGKCEVILELKKLELSIHYVTRIASCN
ncbi:hypothetical protein D0Y65_021871 [Glycine soja]|uniref:RNA polymerase Rpb4/RPC9 core domain-containing protein n=1 Tax=Glycine soja TaxID=3848 RepID=A0A445JKY8_GLYSO|nr:hypothetical protein D0Y65_021871 [Glycine soja]